VKSWIALKWYHCS